MIYQAMTFKEAYQKYFILKENEDIFNRLYFLTTSIDGESYIILALDNNKIIGSYAFEDYDQYNIQTLYLQVDKNYKNKGIATELIHQLFNWAEKNDKGVISSPFSPEGEKYIKKKLIRLSKEYDINYYINVQEFDWFN